MVGFYVDKETYNALESQDFALKSKDMLDQFKASIEPPAPPPQLDTIPVQQQGTGVPTTADISNPTQYSGSPSMTLDDIYRIARQQGLSDEGARAAVAVAKTEGGLTGAAGDNNMSFGPFQFYGGGGQLNNYAKQLGMTWQQAGEYVRQHPADAAQWALRAGGYLGDTIRGGIEKGLTGAALATHAQANGQVSVTPERAGQNYDALYGGGAGPSGIGPSGIGDFMGGVGRTVGDAAGQVGQAVGDAAAPVQDFGANLMADFRAKINAPTAPTAPPEQPTTQLPDTQAQFNTPAEPTAQPKDFGADLMANFRASLDNAGKTVGDVAGQTGEAIGAGMGAAGEAIGAVPEGASVAGDVARQVPGVEGLGNLAGKATDLATWPQGRAGEIVGGAMGLAGQAIGTGLQTAGDVGNAIAGQSGSIIADMPLQPQGVDIRANVPNPATAQAIDALKTERVGFVQSQTDMLTRAGIPSAEAAQMAEEHAVKAYDARITELEGIRQGKSITAGAPTNEQTMLGGGDFTKAVESGNQYMEQNPVGAVIAGTLSPATFPEKIVGGLQAAQGIGDLGAGAALAFGGLKAGNVGGAAKTGAEVRAIVTKMYTPMETGPSLPNGGAMVDAVTLHLFNQNMPLERLQQAAAKAKQLGGGGELQANEMAATLNRMNASGTAERRLQSDLAPVLQDAADRGQTVNLSEYLTYRGNIDVAAAMGQQAEAAKAGTGAAAEANRMFSGGITAADSRVAIQDLAQQLGPQQFAQLEADAGRVASVTRASLDRALESGLIDQETRDLWAAQYPYWTPTKILDYLSNPDKTAAGTKINVNDTGMHSYTIEGTDKARQDPLGAVVNHTYQIEALAAKNETFQAIMRQRDIIPGMADTLPEMPKGYTPTANEIIISGFIDGVKHTLVVPKDMQAAFLRTTRDPILGLQQVMTVYKAMITSRNPAFLASNSLNDMGSYMIRASAREGGPQALPRVTKALFDAYRDAFKGLGTSNFGPKTESMLSTGGAQFGFFQRSEENASKTVNELARRHAFVLRNKSDALRLIKDLVTLQPVEAIGKRIELAPRVAMTELAQARGLSPAAAALEGRSVTMDFAVGGDYAKIINQFVPFFNVGMQAPAQVFRAYRENPKGFVGTVASLLAAPTVAAEAWNRSDPQRAKDYEDIPDYLKAGNIIIMIPGASYNDKAGNIHPQFVAIPTREFSPFVTLTRQAATGALGGDPRSWQELLSDTMQTVSPVQGSNIGEVAGQILPPVLSSVVQEELANKDFFTGAMINTKRKDAQASPLSQAISSGIGGARSPSQIEWLIGDLAGGVGRAAIGASKLTSGDQANAGPSAIPIVGGAVGKFYRGQTGQRLQDTQANILSAPTKQLLKENGVDINLGASGNTVHGVPITVEEQNAYQEQINTGVEGNLQALLASPQWQGLDAATKKKVVDTVVQRTRDQAAGQALGRLGQQEVIRRVGRGSAAQ